ncbi:MAG: VOC family protein [Rubrivivax sp.]
MSSRKYTVGGVEMPRPFKMRRLGHVGITLADLGAARRFYVEQLGFRVTDELILEPGEPPLGFFTSHGTDHHSLACIDARFVGSDPFYEAGVTINQVSFQVGTLEEVVRGHAYFEELGLKVWRVGRDSPGSNWAVYVQDPDGHSMELYYGMEQIGWDRRSKPLSARIVTSEAPDLPQPSEREELAAVEAAGKSLEGGFRPEEPLPYAFDVGGVRLQRPFKVNRIGPVYLFVKDVEKSLNFYLGMMGLEVTERVDWNGHRAAYLRCGSDHHVIALIPEAARAGLGRSGNNTTLAIGVEVGSYKQLRDARAHLMKLGLSPAPALPWQLHPGIEHAVFFMDTAGTTVMLYSGMEQVGWDGRPRPASLRVPIVDDWPEVLASSDTYAGQISLGPLA